MFQKRPGKHNFSIFQSTLVVYQITDWIFASGLISAILLSVNISFSIIFGNQQGSSLEKAIVGLGPLFGSFGIFLMSAYPFHLAFGGDQWIQALAAISHRL